MGSASSDETTDGTTADSDGEHDVDETTNGNAASDSSTRQSTTSVSADDSTSTPSSESQNGTQPTAATQNGAPESDLEVLRALDKFLDDIDEDLPTARERARARDHFDLENRLGESTTTQEKLGFDYVRDDGIAVDENSYIGLLKVHPQNWLSLSDQAKRDTMSAYMSFLMSLESSVAVPCYPKTFDLTGHLERFYTAGASMASRGQTPILQYGRKFYIQWANTNIEDEDLKQRDFYIVTRVDADQVHKDLDTGSVLSQLGTLPVIGTVFSGIVDRTPLGDSHEEARTELCIREVRQRQRRITNKLGRTDVSIERVTDRQETMEILYHYYNHVDPKFEKFSHATKTEGEH
ncbi:hypothetical protein ACFO0N_20030 [Halobium salinum]|uniref:TraC-like domain-containing protein n=1 Tax=Halobium salinum TaxID=1364940 RepID=A0ABD5PHL8_9EURY|nr:hypothetical protein [Halobium salinum]